MNYFIADTHLGHENILKLCNRPFKTIDEMNDIIINNWNNKVKGNDHVYILGDMFFRCEDPEPILRVLKGKKHLIVGNHDGWAKNQELQKYFVSIDNYLEFSDGINYLVLSHYPMLSYHRESRKNTYMIHGHIHANTNADFFPILVNREQILNAGADINGFAPVTIEELMTNNRVHKMCNRKDVMLNDMLFIAEHKATGKRVQFQLPLDLDVDDWCIYIDDIIYENYDDGGIEFYDSKDHEFYFRLKRQNENENGLIKPLKILSANAKADYTLSVQFSNGKNYEFYLKDWLENRIENDDKFRFDDFEVESRYIHWRNTRIYLHYSQLHFDIQHSHYATEI